MAGGLGIEALRLIKSPTSIVYPTILRYKSIKQLKKKKWKNYYPLTVTVHTHYV